jgi:hypothetical protein
MCDLRIDIPKGKFRVIIVDLFDHDSYLYKDYDTQEEAFSIADKKNKKRTGEMDCIFYVYNDKGEYIRGNEAVNQKIQP